MKKRALTLLEIMIVIFLITLITGAIGYNMKGSLDQGRAFRTEQAKEQLEDMLLLCLADHDADAILKDPKRHLQNLGLAKDPAKLLQDGWKEPFKITLAPGKSSFLVKSEAFDRYKAKHRKSSAPQENDED